MHNRFRIQQKKIIREKKKIIEFGIREPNDSSVAFYVVTIRRREGMVNIGDRQKERQIERERKRICKTETKVDGILHLTFKTSVHLKR